MSCADGCLFFCEDCKKNIFAMIARSSSVADILDGIISKIETELEQEHLPSCANQSRFQNVTVSDKKLLSRDSTEDINCRICYDPNQESPVVYSCRCKVGSIKITRWTYKFRKLRIQGRISKTCILNLFIVMLFFLWNS